MADRKTPATQISPEDQEALNANAPYEALLTKAFDKLTSEVFIFLLAYVMLLLGLAMFGSLLAGTIRNVLYILPVLGVLSYVWLQQRVMVKKAAEKGIKLKAGILKDSAQVTEYAVYKPTYLNNGKGKATAIDPKTAISYIASVNLAMSI